MNSTDTSQMSKVERLHAIETIWDSLIHDTSGIESPEWHQDILAARINKIEEGTAQFRPIAELRSPRVK